MRKFIATFLSSALLAGASTATAQVCEENDLAKELQYMRRLSLDLRGLMPSVDEFQSVIDSGSLPASFIDDALDSTDFEHQYGRFLRDQLQINLGYGVVQNVTYILTQAPMMTNEVWWQRLKGPLYRGGNIAEPCLDQPATFTNGVPDVTCSNGVCQEGWVEIQSYWGELVKVCAFDAQDNVLGTNGKACADGNYNAECGCGPNLDYCYRVDIVDGTFSNKPGVFYHKTEDHYIDAINEQVTRIGRSIIGENRPYTDLITTNRMQVNGQLVHFLKNKGGIPNFTEFEMDNYIEPLPNLDYVDKDTWIDIQVTAPGAAGVLTSMFYLLKFASNRARANHFYQTFLCKEFVGPPDGLPPPDDPLNQTPNLMVREGCDYCHKELEPAAAHWGRWNKIGVQHYADTLFPAQDASCIASTDPACELYLTEANHPDEQPYLGYFLPLLFSVDGEGSGNAEIASAVSGGPAALAQAAIADGSFAACTTKNTWHWIMGRAPSALDAAQLANLTTQFTASGYDFKDLVRTLVTSDAYRGHEYVRPEVTP